MSAMHTQVGGSHYKDFAIQPFTFCQANGIGYGESCAIKYLCRWKNKGGIQDLEKAKHFIDMLIEHEQYSDCPVFRCKMVDPQAVPVDAESLFATAPNFFEGISPLVRCGA